MKKDLIVGAGIIVRMTAMRSVGLKTGLQRSRGGSLPVMIQVDFCSADKVTPGGASEGMGGSTEHSRINPCNHYEADQYSQSNTGR